MANISIEKYSKTIKRRKVLQDISLQIRPGEVTLLVGHNGSGKSMLLRAIAGLIFPTSGQVRIDGRIIGKDLTFAPDCGLIIDWPHLTGIECLGLLASIRKTCRREQQRQALVKVGLNPDDTRIVRKYSLGMKQRLAIAQAIMEQPDILLLDEPTNALDDTGLDLFRRIIVAEKKRGATIVIATHSADHIGDLVDFAVKLADGRVAGVKHREA